MAMSSYQNNNNLTATEAETATAAAVRTPMPKKIAHSRPLVPSPPKTQATLRFGEEVTVDEPLISVDGMYRLEIFGSE